MRVFFEYLAKATVILLALAAGRAYFNPDGAWSAWQIAGWSVGAAISLTLERHAKRGQREKDQRKPEEETRQAARRRKK